MGDLAIEARGLTRRFGAVVAVDGLDLKVPRGCVYGFLGPNGAGKTTTIRMLLGLVRPNAGEIRLFEAPLHRRRRHLLRRVGALVETPSLYPHLTGYENLEVTRRLLGLDPTAIDRSLAIVGLQRDAHRLVKGYSLGMRQRLGLALTLLGEPELLVLDEPTNGLDPAGIHEMRSLIRALAEQHGMTVFLSSHLLGEVQQVATHIGIVHRGRLLFEGTLEALRARQQRRVVVGVRQTEHAVRLLAESGWMVEQRPGGTLVVTTGNASDTRVLFSLLAQWHLDVDHFSVEQPSLEDLFLTLTNDSSEDRDD